MDGGGPVMPLTAIQKEISKLIAVNRSPDSYLAGGAALHIEPESIRYSADLDYFHDSVERVAQAFHDDKAVLEKHGFKIEIQLNQPGYIRVEVRKETSSTKIEWARDSAWRFMPTEQHPDSGYQLHVVDLAVNKVLALAGRDEARDFLDILYIHRHILSLGALCWAAVAKDPGYSPLSLLELLKRRGRYRPEDFKTLMVQESQLGFSLSLSNLKTIWLEMVQQAEDFIATRPSTECGCLYYSSEYGKFVTPSKDDSTISPHYAAAGGVRPRFLTTS